MKAFKTLMLLLALGLSAYGQAVNVTANKIKGSATAPSGSCSAQQVQLTTAGVVYVCSSGTWASSGGGTTINGTDGFVPVRTNSTTFGNSAFASNALNSTYLSATSGASGAGLTLAVAGGGTNEALFLNSKGSGNVAIGTTSNDGQFQVQSNISGKPAFYIKGYTTDVASQPLLKLVRGDGALVSEISAGGFAMLGATSFVIGANGTDLIAYNGAKIGWSSSAAVGVSTTTLDTGFARLSAGVVRATNGSTGAGQLLIGTSTDTADAQLSVYSQSTLRAGLKLNMPSGTSGSQEAFGVYDNGTKKLGITTAGTIVGDTTTPNLSLTNAGGALLSYGSSSAFFAGSLARIDTNGNIRLGVYSDGTVGIASTADFGWSSSVPNGIALDVKLARDAANILAQRNGTNAQTFRVYNTYTSGSNYERLGIQASSNAFFITPEAATGTVRELVAGATGSVTRIRSSLATPSAPALADGDWWVECSGTSPTRTCSVMVRDTGATRTIATSVAF